MCVISHTHHRDKLPAQNTPRHIHSEEQQDYPPYKRTKVGHYESHTFSSTNKIFMHKYNLTKINFKFPL